MNKDDLKDRMIDIDSLSSDQKFMFMLLERVNCLEEETESLRHQVQTLQTEKDGCLEAIQLAKECDQLFQHSLRIDMMKQRSDYEARGTVPKHVLDAMTDEQVENLKYMLFAMDLSLEKHTFAFWCKKVATGVQNPIVVAWLREQFDHVRNQLMEPQLADLTIQ